MALSLSGISAQTKLTGTITSAGGEGLPGATVYFPDLRTGAVTKDDGSFEITNLPLTKSLLQVKLIGFKTLILLVDLSKTSTLNLKLEESVIEANEVVVTGVSKATEIKRNPVPMSFIDSKHIAHNSAASAIDVVAKVPGVNVLSSGPNVSKPVIRGLGYNRIITMFDGVRQEGQQWGDEHGVELDQYLVDRAEVVKGPASLIYGSDALAGVINLLPAYPLPQEAIRGTIASDYQTNNGLRAASAALEGNNGGFTWGWRGTYKDAIDFKNRADGRVFNTGFREKDLYLNFGVNRSWGYSNISCAIYDNLQEIPDGSRDSVTRKFTKQVTESDSVRPVVPDSELNSHKINTVHQQVRHYRFISSSNFIMGQGKLGLKLAYQQNRRREYAHPQNPDLAGLSLDISTATYDVKYYFPEKKGWQTTAGMNGMRQWNQFGGGTDFIIPEFRLTDVGPFLYAAKNAGRWDLAAGLRYDTRLFDNDELFLVRDTATGFDKVSPPVAGATKRFSGYRHSFSGLSGSFGLTYNISEKLLVKGNVSRGYRSPNITEIAAGGVHPGTGFMQLGDADLKPEFSLQEDMAVFFEEEHVSASAEVFYNLIDNYIFNQKLSGPNGDDSLYTESGNEYPVFKFRQTKAQLYGGELEVDIHPHPLDWLHIENSVSLVYAQNLGGNGVAITAANRYLPFIPPLHTNSELRAEFRKRKGVFSNIFIKAGFQYYAKQNRVFLAYGTETKTPGYGLADAGVGAHVLAKTGRTIFILAVFVNNLTNEIYQSNMSRLKYMDSYPRNNTGRSGIYSMGRNISFRVTVPLDFRQI